MISKLPGEETFVLFCVILTLQGRKFQKQSGRDSRTLRAAEPAQTKPKLIVKTCSLVNQTQPKLAFSSK